MKRRRVQINDIPDDVHTTLLDSPHRILNLLIELNVEIPGKASYILVCLKLTTPKMDVRFYQAQEDFLLDYTKCLLKNRSDWEFHTFRFEEGFEEWEMFLPPPVVGLGLRTKLRPGATF